MEYRQLGRSGLRVSTMALGTMTFGGKGAFAKVGNVDLRDAARLIDIAMEAGVNLIDTSANYTDGGSERLIGQVLGKLAAAGEIERDQVVVVSKAGYLQGENYQLSQERKAAGRPFAELVLAGQGLEQP